MSATQSPWITDDLVIFQDSIRRFIANELVPHEERWWKQQYIDRDMWRKAGEFGMLLPSIPEQYGGGGGTFAHDAIVTLEQSRAMCSSLGTNVHSGIVAHYLLRYASEEQKLDWLPKMARGEMVGAIAMSEPGAGSDLQAIKTRAVRDGDEYVINGSKTFITNGYHADLILVVAKTDPEKGAKGTSIVVVETRDLPGFRRGRILEKIGQKGQDTTELFFDDVRVPASNLLGPEEGKGFIQLMQQLPQERMIIALGALATMERAVAETVEYVRSRKVFGQTLLDLQNTRFKLAECQSTAVIARAFVDDCMVKVLKGELSGETAAIAKWWSTEQNCKVIDECLQLHGGYGYMLEYPIARMYANARVGRIFGGSNEIMKEIIARTL
ncbi:acyl-CoA dehydrogenase family protein [Pseudomonas sp. BGr12]|uniref:Acyl-[acyl-carrier-protein] dehydrogenase MbtN n=1 Tax=Pseudomonas denitrificans TaxID=43306 RepID=A0A9X7MYP3_PSEDE|nr:MULTISPECIES: acyl-CoA dehydrogenase family protein [Pseudomonadaceae]OQR28420.1 acyl-CoA dehydrogenase [Pseudomonas sp. T]MBD9517123.1 acyl-CoA dehydrogenase family protein [Pseudomonas sp. PDM22]MBD9629634.1 acyl-CoA dehydrogenase family protein [Pseudomonas sp. PDM19]MBD9683890.1 acyl-CoA dehydrogenase family protein [Pseudomonas sp. PDM20]MDL2428156.1 acyl-CoA dehydrogenase family protein [Pseudomonas sp. BJa5]